MKHMTLSMAISLLVGVQLSFAQSSTFTYQGRLTDAGPPATGVYDLQFTLWDAAGHALRIGESVTLEDLSVVDGLFTAALDFGAEAFDGSDRWLEIAVRPGDSTNAFTILTPRTHVLPTPYALFAVKAATAKNAVTASNTPWIGITGLPGGFADGVDNDTQYTAGSGLSLSNVTFSLDTTYADGRYVAKAGDVMTGALSTPNLTVSGAVAADLIDGTSSVLRIHSPVDIEFTIDKDNLPGTAGYFEVFNGAGAHVFYVNEHGDARTYGDHSVDGTVTAAAFTGDGSGLTSAGLVTATVLDVNCVGVATYSTSFTKVADIGAFTKQLAGSTVEVTFNGRLYVDSMSAESRGARFELRVDNQPTTHGRARAKLTPTEVAGGGVQSTITGVFTGLEAGTHTVSIWIEGVFAGGTDAMLDPGCWKTDHVVVKELK
jgi:hypothetical protein